MGWKRAFTVEGLNLERFLAAAAERGVALDGLRRKSGRRIAAAADEKHLSCLQEAAESGGWRMTVGNRVGAGKVADRIRARWALVMAGALLLALCIVATQVGWEVRIVGGGAYEADIRQALTELGIEAPLLRRSVDLDELRTALEWRYPRIAWFECGWRGMTLEIRAVEGVPGAMTGGEDGPCDVVAIRDGIVKNIITRAGTPVVKPGELVRAGQVLIKGEERTSGGEVYPVAARGSVYVRVWDSAAVSTSLYEKETAYTGRTVATQTVACPWFDLWTTEESPYAQEDVSVTTLTLGGLFIPLTIRRDTHYEAEVRTVPRETASLQAENERAALLKLYEIVGGRESLIDKWVNWSIIDDEKLLSVATGERIVDVAQQTRSSGMAAPE